MKSIKYIIFLIIFFCFSLKSECQWQNISLGTNEGLDEICFPNYTTGFATCYPGKIYKTTNSGENWQSIFLDSTLYAFSDIEFINDSTGFFSSRGNKLFKTTNRGATLQVVTFGNIQLQAVNFINQNTGFMATWNYWKVLKSTNSGLNWNELIFTFFPIRLYDVQFLNNDTGYVCGDSQSSGGFIAKTTDGGNNWKRWWNHGLENYSLSFINSQTGYVADYWGALFKTTNGGQDLHWNVIHNFPGNVSEIQAIDENVIYECGTTGDIFRSTNGGYNWERMNSGTIEHLYGMHFLNKDTGYVCGENGTVLRITNASTVGINQISSEIPSSFVLHQNYPNPFNPMTRIRFEIQSEIRHKLSSVTLIVYNALGKEVMVLLNKELNTGVYEVEFNGIDFPSGVYFYKLQSGEFTDIKRMALIK